MKNYDELIKTKKTEVSNAETIVSSLKNELRLLRIEKYSAETGLNNFDTVKVTDRVGKVKIGQIQGFETKWSTVEPEIFEHKKDGNVGMRKIQIWSIYKIEKL